MYKKCKVVMLPTHPKSRLILKDYKYLEYNDKYPSYGVNQLEYKCKHLYILFKESKSIIAVTDSSFDLPSIPQSFIERYVEEYNKGNIIEDVMVEYDHNLPEYGGVMPRVSATDNTINIKIIKDSWNRAELLEQSGEFYKRHCAILNLTDMQSIIQFIKEL